jgi:hypothetical protein
MRENRGQQNEKETDHDVLLNVLHNVGEETLGVRDHAKLPHLVRDETDEMSREDDLLVRREVLEARDLDLETPDEAFKHVLVELLDVLQHPHHHLVRILVLDRQAVEVLEPWHSVRSKGSDGDGSVLIGVSLADVDHELVCRVTRLGAITDERPSRVTTTIRSVGRLPVERASFVRRRRVVLDVILERTKAAVVRRGGRRSVSVEDGEGLSSVEGLSEGRELALETRDGGGIFCRAGGGVLDDPLPFGESLGVAGGLLGEGSDGGLVIEQLPKGLSKAAVQRVLGLLELVESSLRDGRSLQLGVQALSSRLGLLVLGRRDLLEPFELVESSLEILLLGRPFLERLGELDDLVLELVGDLLELRGRASLDLELLELSLGEMSSIARLQMHDALDLEGERTTSQAAQR